MLKKYVLSFSLVIILEIVNGVNVLSDSFSSGKEYEVKAVFLFNFINFIRWPETALSPNAAMKLCVVGDDPFEGLLEGVVLNEKNSKHPIGIQRLKYPRDDLGECHILFVSRSEQDNYSKILAFLAQKPVLTVGETEDFLSQGGMVEFYMQNQRVRLSMSLSRLRTAQLNANANLLKVAKILD
jgi:hypothetical protein